MSVIQRYWAEWRKVSTPKSKWAIQDMITKINKGIEYGLEEEDFKYYNQGLIVLDVLIARKINMFRPLGELDWAYYPRYKILVEQLLAGNTKKYYKEMLKHEKSPPNIWKRPEEEKQKKKFYKQRMA